MIASQRVDRGVGVRALFRQRRLRPLAELVSWVLRLASRRHRSRRRGPQARQRGHAPALALLRPVEALRVKADGRARVDSRLEEPPPHRAALGGDAIGVRKRERDALARLAQARVDNRQEELWIAATVL